MYLKNLAAGLLCAGLSSVFAPACAADATDAELAALALEKAKAEARKAIAEAEKAETAAKIPATETKALAGTTNTEKFGAAGLVKAFDLAVILAGETCKAIQPHSPVAIYDAAATQGVVLARALDASLTSMDKQVSDAKKSLETVVGVPVPAPAAMALPLALGLATGAIKAAADLASLAKTNVTVVGTTYGDGAKGLFTTSLAQQCPGQVTGLGVGYLGELDLTYFNALKERVIKLSGLRNEFSDRIATAKKMAEAEKDPQLKKKYAEAIEASAAMLKIADAFIESLKAADVSDKSPLYNAARFMSYAARTSQSNVLDFDLRLEGLSITKENIFTGQKLRLSGVAFLTYRVYRQDGSLLASAVHRRITKPAEVDLRGSAINSDFWAAEK